MLNRLDWVRGDAIGLDIPAHGESLRTGGADFLTRAFHASGSLALAGKGAQIILACRDPEKAEAARKKSYRSTDPREWNHVLLIREA